MNTKDFIIKFKKTLKENAIVTAVIGIMWLVLGWLKSYGINNIFLFPFNYVSGALIGVDGGSFVGGIIGKTLMLMILNSLIRPFLFSKGDKKERITKSINQFKSSALSKIPQYKNITQLLDKDHIKRSYNLVGFGLSFLLYPFITGNGSFQNSGVCVLVAIALFKELKKQRSLIVHVINYILKKYDKKQISKENMNRLISGNALGFACTVIFSLISGYNALSYVIGCVVIIVGIFEMGLLKNIRKDKVEVA
ncbi:MAG: hypothetical protein AB7V48_12385 [Sedimentibacter sp.]